MIRWWRELLAPLDRSARIRSAVNKYLLLRTQRNEILQAVEVRPAEVRQAEVRLANSRVCQIRYRTRRVTSLLLRLETLLGFNGVQIEGIG